MDLTKKHCVPCEGGILPLTNYEENRYKKTYASDARRVSWLVNNRLSEDYESMPISMKKKWPKAAYKRERFLAKIEDEDGLRRESGSGAIVNVDRSAWESARERARAAQKSRDELRGQAREINTLKCEMHEIKNMLQTIMDKQ